ncbi:cutinase transcription factor 1 beta [Trichoderma reesei QM6a]|uniref:Cutinase transcription factor 1 beta n=2 Tax=Hypocrea jecorina TaxID=51453 RepID=G0RHG1_HYPJQ|nr:cutinase transcription factor 1 beta [Trichoderma reesei QM6a]EGR49281.1 cutinase transcription factor 1 beta [Trichoderma reesei QM6a]
MLDEPEGETAPKDGPRDLLEEFAIESHCLDAPMSMEDLELLRADIESDKSPRDSLSDMVDTFNLPNYVRPLTSLPPDDMEFLHAEGALTLPDSALQNALLRAFFEYVHPYVPTLDLDAFLHSIETPDGSAGQVSLLLLQAVLAAGTAHVELHHLRNAGYQTRKQARTAFLKRVRLLYKYNCELDQMVLTQSLLLITSWQDASDEHGKTWFWIDAAVSHAFAAGLHLEPSVNKPNLSRRKQRLRRRVWWCCFIRDRLLSLGMKRPPRIKDGDFQVAMLDEADFQPEQIRSDDGDHARFEAVCVYVRSRKKRAELARMCVAQATLCRSMSFLSSSMYVAPHDSLAVPSSSSQEAGATRARPRADDGGEQKLFTTYIRDLLEWRDGLPEGVSYRPISSSDIGRDGNTSISLDRAVLHMIYYAAVLCLYRSRFVALLQQQQQQQQHGAGDSSSSSWSMEKELCKTYMQHSAKRIGDIARNIYDHGLDRLLPSMAANIAVSAASVHLLELRGQLQGCGTEPSYRQSRRLMQSMHDIYAGADLSRESLKWHEEEEQQQQQERREKEEKGMSWSSPGGEVAAETGGKEEKEEEDYLVADADWLKDLEAATCWYVAEPYRADSFLQYPGEGLDVVNEFFAF